VYSILNSTTLESNMSAGANVAADMATVAKAMSG
jgi:hypothetical protein